MEEPSTSTSTQSKVEGMSIPSTSVASIAKSLEVESIAEVIENAYTENPQNAPVYTADDEAKYMANCGFTGNYYDSQEELKHEREEIAKAVLNKEITPGRAKLQLWLYRSMRIVMTDGRILIGIFLCTDSDANVILGVCSEFTKDGGDERMLGLVMVPGRHIVSMHLDTRCAANNPFQATT